MPIDSITSAKDLVDVANELAPRMEFAELWWRGQAQNTWKLQAGAHRGGKPRKWEISRTARFLCLAPSRYSNCPSSRDQWLFLMQHYGLATRLLDWTQSPLIAAYFAVCEAESCDGTLWALNPFCLNSSQTHGPRVVLSPADSDFRRLIGAAFDEKQPPQDNAFAISTTEIDVRMLTQLSVFTVHGSSKPLETFDQADTFLSPYRIPSSAKAKIGTDLARLGIRLPNLYPDLQHLSEYLNQFTYWD